MCTAGARGAETDRGGPARRGPKNNGRGSAPNVRAWGARQLTIGMVCLYAFLSGEVAAYTAMLVAVTSRVTGDVLQNIIDGCWWKLAVFVPVEGLMAGLLYMALSP